MDCRILGVSIPEMKIKKEIREFDRWHLQPEDFIVIARVPVKESEKKAVLEWIEKHKSK
jgi:hypothetical protein